jgi:hypothetical protein
MMRSATLMPTGGARALREVSHLDSRAWCAPTWVNGRRRVEAPGSQNTDMNLKTSMAEADEGGLSTAQMQRLISVSVLSVALLARAEEAMPPSTTPPIIAAEEDRSVIYTDEYQILYGEARKELTPVQLFEVLGRTDLVEQAKVNSTRRTALIISAVSVAAVGVGLGIGLLATAPNLQTGRCNMEAAYFNDVCVPLNSAHQVGGATSIAGGLIIGAILGSVAWWTRPEVFTRYELGKFIDQHNASLVNKKPTSFHFELSPSLSPAFAGLVATGTF